MSVGTSHCCQIKLAWIFV
uniref:Uncharacterized protein n=1 Tax=Rhizophora mucronata TaxID=61149 RepID=A0A2P2QFB5_RHIMU